MAETKKIFKKFAVSQWEKEQEFLMEQHRAGWKLEKITGMGTYNFIKCQPENVIYHLDCNPTGSANKEYMKQFRETGWEYLQDFGGYCYFRKAKEFLLDEETAFCSDGSRLAMLRHVMRNKMLLPLVIFVLLLVPQMVVQFMNGNFVFGVILAVIIALFLTNFLPFWVNYMKFRKQVTQNL